MNTITPQNGTRMKNFEVPKIVPISALARLSAKHVPNAASKEQINADLLAFIQS